MSPDWASEPEAAPYSSLDDPQSLNLYGYVRNNPLSRIDGDGHEDDDGDGDGDPDNCTCHALAGALQMAINDFSDSVSAGSKQAKHDALVAGFVVGTAVYLSTDSIRKNWESYWGRAWPIDPATGKKQDVSHEPTAKADGGTDNVRNNVSLVLRKFTLIITQSSETISAGVGVEARSRDPHHRRRSRQSRILPRLLPLLQTHQNNAGANYV
jgi:hypothetical protein